MSICWEGSVRREELRRRRAWYLARAEEYESGTHEAGTESSNVATLWCAEMAANSRRWDCTAPVPLRHLPA